MHSLEPLAAWTTIERFFLAICLLSAPMAAAAGEEAGKDAGKNADKEVGKQGVADEPRLTGAKTADGKLYISWKEHRIDDSALNKASLGGADGLAVADLDQDGCMDVVAVHEDAANHVRISFGTKDPHKWESYTLSPGPNESKDSPTRVGGAEDVVIGDVNGDGRLDVVACGEGGSIVYFEAPEDPRQMAGWKRVSIAAPGAGKDSWIRVDLADLDGDGKLEILGAHKKGSNEWACFRREGDACDFASWKRLVLGRCGMPINIQAVDIDGDGDMDVLGGSRGEHKIVLFENLGHDKKWEEKWKEHPIVLKANRLRCEPVTVDIAGTQVKAFSEWGVCGGFMMVISDIDRDGRLDILSAPEHGGAIFWLKQPEKLGGEWKRFYIGHIAPDQVTGLELADIDGDGRPDLFTGGYSYTPRRADPKTIYKPGASCGRLAWFAAPADPAKAWTRHDVSRRGQGMYDMFVGRDINGDGLMDFYTTRGNSSPLDGAIWLEQVRTAEPVPAFTSAWPADQDSRQQPIPQDVEASDKAANAERKEKQE